MAQYSANPHRHHRRDPTDWSGLPLIPATFAAWAAAVDANNMLQAHRDDAFEQRAAAGYSGAGAAVASWVLAWHMPELALSVTLSRRVRIFRLGVL